VTAVPALRARDTTPSQRGDADVDADADADDGETAWDASPCAGPGRTRCRATESPRSDEGARADAELAGCPATAGSLD